MKTSTTQKIPNNASSPEHVAIIMDGNGRWAKERYLPRVLGHRSGLKAVRKSVELCHQNNIRFLTLFAFSSENWRRPLEEVSFLLALFQKSLEEEVVKLDKNNVRFKVIGDRSKFSTKLQDLIQESERITHDNTGLTLTVAANYGGRWDIVNAAKQAALNGHVNLSEDTLSQYLQLEFAPEPDLLIRTGGEVRISNFVIWDLVYTELYFTDVLWPDFDVKHFYEALSHYADRNRRFGRAEVDQDAVSENIVDS